MPCEIYTQGTLILEYYDFYMENYYFCTVFIGTRPWFSPFLLNSHLNLVLTNPRCSAFNACMVSLQVIVILAGSAC